MALGPEHTGASAHESPDLYWFLPEATPLSVEVSVVDADADEPLLDAQTMVQGRYRLLFAVAPYFRSRGVALPEPPFIDTVQIDFGIADAASHYHVPLLVSPWSYSTYRGS